ncbi:MAG: phosphopantetheine-binding protein [Oscillospiraceae bacterium]|jgi:acyl carrier protein|nr:phosphopantetheine-binding protein [Oscillospiraceae bacterium]
MDTTVERIIELLAETISEDASHLHERSALTPEAGVEPIDLAKLVIDCEKAFTIQIHDEDVHTFRDVWTLAEYITAALDDI